MAKPDPSAFCGIKWENDKELLAAQILPGPTKDWLQSLLSIAAQKKLNLKYDPTNQLSFLQEDAAIQAEIVFIQWLLAVSDAAVEALSIDSSTSQL